jgi:hypothetical protein
MNVWIENTSRQTLITQQMPKMQRTLGTWRTPKTWQLNKLRTWWINELGTWQESRSQRTNKKWKTWQVSRLWGTLGTWQTNKLRT